MNAKTVILAGSGHSHLEVLKSFSENEIAKHRFLLVSPHRHTYYSALVPRFIAGLVGVEALTIDSARFAERKGVRFVKAKLESIDRDQKSILLSNGDRERFDILSINIGGTPDVIPTRSSERTFYLRPFDQFLSRWPEFERVCESNQKLSIVVVGGGAAAVEVATALKLRLTRSHPNKNEVHIISRSSKLCASYTSKVSTSILESLTKLGVRVHFNEPVTKVGDQHLELQTGQTLQFDSVFIVTPTEPSNILPDPVNASLESQPDIFATGDCTSMTDYPDLPRSGVVAVRQGQLLSESLRARIIGQKPKLYAPQNKMLNILISGDGQARLVFANLSFEGRLALRFKNWIDNRYMKSFEEK